MKNKVMELTNKEYEYLQNINLNLTYQEKLYFDYDFIINNIDKTPIEIYRMNDGIDKSTLSWFDDLFAKNLESFWGPTFAENFTDNLRRDNENCPLNDKESAIFKDYVTYKRIFALSLKMMAENKTETFVKAYDDGITTSSDDEVKDYTAKLSSTTDGVFDTPDKNYIDFKPIIKKYIYVYKDKKKPKIPADTSFKNLMKITQKAANNEELTKEEFEIADYIAEMIEEDSLEEAFSPKNPNQVNNKIYTIFIIAALIDNLLGRGYSEKCFEKFCAKENLGQKIQLEDGFAGTQYGESVKNIDYYLCKIKVLNNYQDYGKYVFASSSRYQMLKDKNGVSDEIVAEDNKKYFDRQDNGQEISYNIIDGSNTKKIKLKLTNGEIEADNSTIEATRNFLKNVNATQLTNYKLSEIIAKMLKKQPLNEDEKKLLQSNSIPENSSEEDLKKKKDESEKEYNRLKKGETIRTASIETLDKAEKILKSVTKKKKNDFGKIKEKVKDLKNLANPEILKKWAKKLPKAVCPIIGGAVGYNLAFVLGPVGIVAANAIGAFVITQARAYANILEEQELSEEEIEIDSIEKPSNKLCNKVSALLRKANLEKLATFNMFEKLSNSKSEKISNFFRNKEVLITIANTVTAGLVAMDLNALRRVISKLAKHQNEIPKKEFESDSNLGANKGEIKPSTGTGSESGSGLTSGAGNTNEISMKVGDNIGTESKIINGYKNSYDAYNGVNGVHLNQSIINDGDTIIKNLYYNSNGKMIKLPIEHGQDIIETIENLGINPKDVVANLANSDGTGRAWVHITDVAKTLGRSL